MSADAHSAPDANDRNANQDQSAQVGGSAAQPSDNVGGANALPQSTQSPTAIQRTVLAGTTADVDQISEEEFELGPQGVEDISPDEFELSTPQAATAIPQAPENSQEIAAPSKPEPQAAAKAPPPAAASAAPSFFEHMAKTEFEFSNPDLEHISADEFDDGSSSQETPGNPTGALISPAIEQIGADEFDIDSQGAANAEASLNEQPSTPADAVAGQFKGTPPTPSVIEQISNQEFEVSTPQLEQITAEEFEVSTPQSEQVTAEEFQVSTPQSEQVTAEEFQVSTPQSEQVTAEEFQVSTSQLEQIAAEEFEVSTPQLEQITAEEFEVSTPQLEQITATEFEISASQADDISSVQFELKEDPDEEAPAPLKVPPPAPQTREPRIRIVQRGQMTPDTVPLPAAEIWANQPNSIIQQAGGSNGSSLDCGGQDVGEVPLVMPEAALTAPSPVEQQGGLEPIAPQRPEDSAQSSSQALSQDLSQPVDLDVTQELNAEEVQQGLADTAQMLQQSSDDAAAPPASREDASKSWGPAPSGAPFPQRRSGVITKSLLPAMDSNAGSGSDWDAPMNPELSASDWDAPVPTDELKPLIEKQKAISNADRFGPTPEEIDQQITISNAPKLPPLKDLGKAPTSILGAALLGRLADKPGLPDSQGPEGPWLRPGQGDQPDRSTAVSQQALASQTQPIETLPPSQAELQSPPQEQGLPQPQVLHAPPESGQQPGWPSPQLPQGAAPVVSAGQAPGSAPLPATAPAQALAPASQPGPFSQPPQGVAPQAAQAGWPSPQQAAAPVLSAGQAPGSAPIPATAPAQASGPASEPSPFGQPPQGAAPQAEQAGWPASQPPQAATPPVTAGQAPGSAPIPATPPVQASGPASGPSSQPPQGVLTSPNRQGWPGSQPDQPGDESAPDSNEIQAPSYAVHAGWPATVPGAQPSSQSGPSQWGQPQPPPAIPPPQEAAPAQWPGLQPVQGASPPPTSPQPPPAIPGAPSKPGGGLAKSSVSTQGMQSKFQGQDETGRVLLQAVPVPHQPIPDDFGKEMPGLSGPNPVVAPLLPPALEALKNLEARFDPKAEPLKKVAPQAAPKPQEEQQPVQPKAQPEEPEPVPQPLPTKPRTAPQSQSGTQSPYMRHGLESAGLMSFLRGNWKAMILAGLVVVVLGCLVPIFMKAGHSGQVPMGPEQQAGKDAYKVHQYAEAVNCFDRAIKAHPKRADIYHDRGKAYLALGNYKQALADQSSALALSPGLHDALQDRAVAYFYLQDYTSAISDYNQLLAKDSKDPDALLGRGLCYASTKRYDEALHDLDRATTIASQDPARDKDPTAWEQKGAIYLHLKMYDRSITAFNEALRRNPRSASSEYQLGNNYLFLSKPDGAAQHYKQDAIQHYTDAIAIDPGKANYYSDRGYMLMQMHKIREAIEDFNSALELSPGDKITEGNLQVAAASVLKDAEIRLSINKDSIKGLCDSAIAYLSTGKPQLALDATNKAVIFHPNSAEAFTLRSRADLELGKYEDAVKDAASALKLDSGSSEDHLIRARAYLRLKQYTDALSDYSAVVDGPSSFRKQVFAVRERAVANLLLMKGKEAADDARQYLTVNGWDNALAGQTALLAWLGYKEQVHADEAKAMLAEAKQKIAPSRWPYPIFKYLGQEITKSDLTALANDPQQLTDVRTWCGFDRLMSDHTKEAKVEFDWVKAKGVRTGDDYILAEGVK